MISRRGRLLAWTLAAAWGLTPAHALPATLVYSNDVLGEIEPCGCKADPLGGLVRKQGLLKTIADKDLLQLDGGNLLFPGETIAPALQDQAKLQAHYLVKALNLLKQSAAVPGPNDFALGLKVFEKLRREAHFPFLAANLAKKDGASFLQPYRIFNLRSGSKGHLRVAVLGLVSNTISWPTEEIKTSPALEAALKWIPLLKKKSDILIALTHQGIEADEDLASKVPGIDMIVGGHSMSFLLEPKKVNTGGSDTYLFQSSYKNQYVGVVPIEKPFQARDHRLVPLDPSFDNKGSIDKLVVEFKKAIQKLNDQEARTADRAAGPKVVEKFHTFPKCAGCHMKQFDFWRKTQHALALHALMTKSQASNKECLQCHTVGFQDKQGFTRPRELATLEDGSFAGPELLASYLQVIHDAATLDQEVKFAEKDEALPLRTQLSRLKKSWAPVQCESCHQPGLNHPFEGTYSKTVAKDACLKCHTRERAPEWFMQNGAPNWEKISQKRSLITCPAGD